MFKSRPKTKQTARKSTGCQAPRKVLNKPNADPAAGGSTSPKTTKSSRATKSATGSTKSPTPKPRSSAHTTPKGRLKPGLTLNQTKAASSKSKPPSTTSAKSSVNTTKGKAASSTSKSPTAKGSTTSKTTPTKSKTTNSSTASKTGPKTLAGKAPAGGAKRIKSRTVHEALFSVGVSLEPVPARAWRVSKSRNDRICAAIPPPTSGSPRLTFLDGTKDHRELVASLRSRLSADCAAPKAVSVALDGVKALHDPKGLTGAVACLLTTAKVWKGGTIWGNRAWAVAPLEHCPMFHDSALVAGGATAGLLTVHEKLFAALIRAIQHGGKVGSDMRNKTGLRIWVRNGEPEGENEIVQIGLQLFYAMHSRGWSDTIILDGRSFATVRLDSDVLRVSAPVSVMVPTGLSLLGAMTELLVSGGLPQSGPSTSKPVTPKSRAKKATAAGGSKQGSRVISISQSYMKSETADSEMGWPMDHVSEGHYEDSNIGYFSDDGGDEHYLYGSSDGGQPMYGSLGIDDETQEEGNVYDDYVSDNEAAYDEELQQDDYAYDDGDDELMAKCDEHYNEWKSGNNWGYDRWGKWGYIGPQAK